MERAAKKRMRLRKVILATTVLASLCILMAGLALAAWYERVDSISQTPGLLSAYPDVAVSGDEAGQEYVAAVWTENSGGKHAGVLKLRWGPPGENWEWPFKSIENSSSQSQVPAVAVYSDTAYIAYTKRPEEDDIWRIGYAESQYGYPQYDTYDVHIGDSVNALGSVDIAFCTPTIHIVWADTTNAPDDDIWYESSDVNTIDWSSAPTRVSDNSTDDSSPSVACYGNTVHVAWIEDGRYVQYRKESGGWQSIKELFDSEGLVFLDCPSGDCPPLSTSIAAYGDYVDVVWDYSSEDPPGINSDYFVREWRRIEPNECTHVLSGTHTSPSASEYLHYLQPDVAVYSYTASTAPIPVVVWHADNEDTRHYVIYSYGTSFGNPDPCSVAWSEPAYIVEDEDRHSAAPSIAIGISDTVTHTHVVFQSLLTDTWEIYYTNDFGGPLTLDEAAHGGVYLPIIMKNHQ